MLGIRGARMLIMHPNFAEIQIKAIVNAIFDAKRKFGKLPQLSILIPMISLLPEYEIIKKIIDDTINDALNHSRIKFEYQVGCMIETPRACFIADKIAETCDFVCFGTNDLTQLSFGFARDDCMKFLKDYYQDNLIYSDPFKILDKNGVFELIKVGIERVRKTNAKMPIWLLGYMDCDQTSLRLATKLKVNAISCVPNHIPAAIIAQSQAVIQEKLENANN
jgi:pyruvate,orthophosphate dikinase